MTVQDDDDPNGAAQQVPQETNLTAPVHRPIEEELKEPEPPQTVELAVEATTSDPSINAHPRVI